jgi:hypothetical protein
MDLPTLVLGPTSSACKHIEENLAEGFLNRAGADVILSPFVRCLFVHSFMYSFTESFIRSLSG